MKNEAKKMMSIRFLETLNIEWGQIDPKGNRRVTTQASEKGAWHQGCKIIRASISAQADSADFLFFPREIVYLPII